MSSKLLNDIYKRQGKIIYGYLIKRGCSKQEAEDIVHDSFLKAIEYIDGVSLDKVYSWLFKISINNYNNYVKRKNIIKEVSINNDILYTSLIEDTDLSRGLIREDLSKDIVKTLEQMRELYKTLLIMKYDLELSYKDIGKLLDMSQDMVKTYLYRARNEFKKIWRDVHEEGLR